MKKRCLLFLFLFCIAMPTIYNRCCYSMNLENKVVTSDKQSYINGIPIHCYEMNGEIYIIAEDLAKYGFCFYFFEDTRTLSIYYDTSITVYAPKELEDRGQQCFDLYQSNIVTLMGNEMIPSYNINGQTIIPIKSLEHYGIITYSDDNCKIYFEITPEWYIILPDNHEGDTSQELSHFKLEIERNQNGKWIVTGENRQYLYNVVLYWEKYNKTYIQFCIPKTLSTQSQKILKLFENNPDLNSKQKSAQQYIDIANMHTSIYINGEKVNITHIKYESESSPYNNFWLYLDKDIFSQNDLQTLTIECKE